MDNHLPVFKLKIKSSIKNNTLGHAYLLTGSNLDYLKQVVFEIICEIEFNKECPSDSLLFKRLSDGNYSDLMEIDNEDKSIKINDIKKISSFLQLKTIEGIYRIILINHADKMTTEAQNALLKILEEPYGNSLIILLSEAFDAFLPTVLSRVQIIRLNQLERNVVAFISSDNQELIAQHMQRILLLGDITSIFTLSDILSPQKNRLETEKHLSYLYLIFLKILQEKQLNDKYNHETNLLHQVSIGLTPSIMDKILNTILDTIKQIKQNSSLNLSVQAMLIKIQEDYNAENSRNTI